MAVDMAEVMSQVESVECYRLANPFVAAELSQAKGKIAGYPIKAACAVTLFARVQPLLLDENKFNTSDSLRCLFSPAYLFRVQGQRAQVEVLVDVNCGVIKLLGFGREDTLNANPALREIQQHLPLAE